MTSPYHGAFGYLYPRPLVVPPFIRSSVFDGKHSEPEKVLSQPTAANTLETVEIRPEPVRVGQCRPVDNRPRTLKSKLAHVKSKITPEETRRYFDRKKDRELLRIKLQLEKEVEEMSECTFHPKISQYRHKY